MMNRQSVRPASRCLIFWATCFARCVRLLSCVSGSSEMFCSCMLRYTHSSENVMPTQVSGTPGKAACRLMNSRGNIAK